MENSPPITIALAGNPNVGKSTIFNALTGLRQHTGNWPGKTVASATGTFLFQNQAYHVIDLPGTYSLSTHSEEEEIARNYLCSGEADMIMIVCDATCLERGLHLLNQILNLEYVKDTATPIILCVNLCDEAKKKGIVIDFDLLRDILQIPVLCSCARDMDSIKHIKETIALAKQQSYCYDCLDLNPKVVTQEIVLHTKPEFRKRESQIDRIITGPLIGSFLIFCLLLVVFWLTLAGANVPSAMLSDLLFGFEEPLATGLLFLHAPTWFVEVMVYGIYRVLAWVVSVMLPPMAIFFPLFTLLEDWGLLPRIAFRMDYAFQCCHACGKQCLTTAMGFGCNAAGVIGCRIIDSPRERLIAIITNSLVPCNGRLPTLFVMITLLHLANGNSFVSALLLTLTILVGVGATLLCSFFLSKTLLKGIPSAFTLELPPYRRPQIGKVIVRSIFDRTLFVLGRAVIVAAPAGLIIWILANISISNAVDAPTLLTYVTNFFEPLGKLMGLDGVILTAFILGFPANEIVLPLIIMTYMQSNTLIDMADQTSLLNLLTANGWTPLTIVCMILFCLFHWPCSTTLLTIKKETNSWKWTLISALMPTTIGIVICIITTWLTHIIW